MRIAHIITRMIVGGAQENTLLTCQDLIRYHGDDVLLITGPEAGPEGNLLARDYGAPKVPTKIIPAMRRSIGLWRESRAYFAIKRALREYKPDVVHTHSAKAGILGRIAAAAVGVPVVVHTVHGAPFYPRQNFFARRFAKFCEWYAARRCDRLLSVADAMTELLIQAGTAPREQFLTIHSGMATEPFLAAHEHRRAMREQLGIGPKEVVIGKIARLFPLKGHDDLLLAAEKVIAANPNVRFLLIGDGILREKLNKQIAAKGMDRHFLFAGLIDPREIPKYVSAMDLVVHTSLREGLARALPQALLAGKPVVSYDIDGAREVCRDGETGFLIPPRDLFALSQALLRLAGDEALRERLGKRGRANFAGAFDHRRQTERIRQVYEEEWKRCGNDYLHRIGKKRSRHS